MGDVRGRPARDRGTRTSSFGRALAPRARWRWDRHGTQPASGRVDLDLEATDDCDPASAADVAFVAHSRDDVGRLIRAVRGQAALSAEDVQGIAARCDQAGNGPWRAFLEPDGGMGGSNVTWIGDRRCRGDASPNLWRGRRHQGHARPHRSLLRSEAEAAGRRHGLRHGQVPGLARQREDCAAHPWGAPQARGWHLLHFRLPMGRATRRLHLPRWQAAQNQRNRALRRETTLPRPQARLRCLPAGTRMLPEGVAARYVAHDVHEDARDVAQGIGGSLPHSTRG